MRKWLCICGEKNLLSRAFCSVCHKFWQHTERVTGKPLEIE